MIEAGRVVRGAAGMAGELGHVHIPMHGLLAEGQPVPRCNCGFHGDAESVASFAKLFSGYITDRAHRRKPLVVAGYVVANGVKPLLAVATSWWHVLFIRFSDRLAKGVRGAPRDVMVAESVATPGPVGPAGGGAIEIEFAAGARMRITGTVDAATLKAAVAALADGSRR